MSNQKKYKRRSSLAPGRIQFQPRADREKDLYRDIDKSLPDEERLAAFTQSCFQYTLEKLIEEVDDTTEFSELKKEATLRISKVISSMKENQLFHEACTKQSCLPNPINSEMDEAIAEIEGQAESMNAESEQWSSMESELEERLNSLNQLGENRKLTEDEVPEHVKVQAKLYMPDTIDYSRLLTDVDKGMAETALLIEKQVNSLSLLRSVQKKASDIIDKRYKQLCDVSALHTISPKSLVEGYM
ncbi:hypothetical protein ScPMuIL_011119 [Solemya velum]